MLLRDWIRTQGLLVREAAEELEMHPTHLSDIMSWQDGRPNRKKGVSVELAARIESYTAGEVTTDDILYPRGKPAWKYQRVGRVLVHTVPVSLEPADDQGAL